MILLRPFCIPRGLRNQRRMSSLITRIDRSWPQCKTECVVDWETLMRPGAGRKLERLRVLFANLQPTHTGPQELSCRNDLRNDLPAGGIPCQELKFSGVIRGTRQGVLRKI